MQKDPAHPRPVDQLWHVFTSVGHVNVLHFLIKLLFVLLSATFFDLTSAAMQALCLRASGRHEVPQKHEAWQVAALVAHFEATPFIQIEAVNAPCYIGGVGAPFKNPGRSAPGVEFC